MKEFIFTVLLFFVEINLLDVESYKLDIEPITPVYWINKEEIFVNELEEAYIFNTKSRSIVNKYEKGGNEILGYEDGELYTCRWSNREIHSLEEYSTLLEIKIEGSENKKIEIKPTVEPIDCREEIIMRTVFPLEENFYLFKDNLYQIGKYKQDFLSPNLLSFIKRSALGQYYINSFSP